MSRGGLSNPSNHRDYGATSSSTNVITTIPDVNFSGFSPTEFMSLSENIGQNINAVKTSWKQLESALRAIDNNRGPQMNFPAHKVRSETNKKIQATSKDLQRLTSLVRRGDKQQKLQVEKLTSDFRTVVEKYSASEKQFATKMKKILLQSDLAQQQDDESYADNMSSNINKEQLLQRQKQLESGIQFEQDMVLDREMRIKEIEADVLDVNTIMKELSSLVHQQGQEIDTIESSIDHACAEVEAGTSELMKAAQYRARYRRKVFILLIIAVIIGLIVTGIIVSQLKS